LQQWALDNEELQHLEDVTSVYTYSEAILSQIIISIYEAEEQVNMAASMLWGIPAMHAQAWEESVNSGPPDVADERAYASVSDQLKESPEDPNAMLAIGYYNAFARAWNATSEVPGMVADPVTRANGAVINAAPPFIGGLPLLDEEKQVMLAVLNGFNVTTFNDATLVHGFTLGMVGNAAQITNTTFLQGVYDLGPVYDEAKVAAYAHTVVAESTLDELLGAMPADLQDNFETLLNNFVSDEKKSMLLLFNFNVSAAYVDDDGTFVLMDYVKVIRDKIAGMNAETDNIVTAYVTGEAAISEDMRASSEEDMKMIQPVTIFIIIVLMGILFRSVVAQFLPLGAVGMAIGISHALMFAVGTLVSPVNVMVPTLLFAILMGVGTDYAIFIVSRYREERVKGATREQAVHASVTWAGEAIVTSGATVIIAFFAMAISSFPMVQIMGLVLGLGIVVALLLSLTLVPSVLMLFGNRMFWPNTGKRWDRYASNIMEKRRTAKHGYFHRAGSFAVKHAKVILIVALLVSIPSTYLFVAHETSFDFISSMGEPESIEGMNAMTEDFGAGRIMPTQIVITGDTIIYNNETGEFNLEYLDAVNNVTSDIANSPSVQQVNGITWPYGEQIDYRSLDQLHEEERNQIVASMLQDLSTDRKSVILTVILKEQPMSFDMVHFIPDLRDNLSAVMSSEPLLSNSEIMVGGATAANYDMSLTTTQQFTTIEIVVVIGIFIVLLLVLGSVLLPAFAVISIAMSITWAYALTYLVFGTLLEIPILWLVPLVLFVILMGIGMDYNVFILTRIREEVHKGKEIKEAVVDAVDWTGGIITALACIMAGAFGSIMLSSNAMLQQFGFALLVAVLLDAMVVRTYIVPAAVTLMGKWAWWAPGPLQRVGREEKRKKKLEGQ